MLFTQEIPDAQWQRAIEYLGEVSELNYMTQIVFMLYEDPKAEPQSDQQFYLRLHFSNGARTIDDPRYVGSPVRVHGEGNLNFDPWILSPWGEFVKGQKEDGVTGAEDVATPRYLNVFVFVCVCVCVCLCVIKNVNKS